MDRAVKRSVGASERDEFLRAARRMLVAGEAGIDAERLAFVDDEMGANISLAPLCGWSRRRERAFVSMPRNWGRMSRSCEHDLEGDGPVLGGRMVDCE